MLQDAAGCCRMHSAKLQVGIFKKRHTAHESTCSAMHYVSDGISSIILEDVSTIWLCEVEQL